MAKTQDQWDIFWDWEFQLNVKSDPKRRMIDLRLELRQEWNNITDKDDYIQSLQELQNSTKTVASHARQVRLCRQSIEDKRTRRPMWDFGSGAVGAYREWKEAIQKYLKSLESHLEAIAGFEYEQDLLNIDGNPNGNARSREHTAQLLQETLSTIEQTESQLEECKQLLTKHGVPRSPGGEDLESRQQDDNDRKQQETQQERTSTRRGSRAGVLQDPIRKGGNDGQGAGAGAPGGSGGDGEKAPWIPISKPDGIESDDQDEGQRETDEQDYIAFDKEDPPSNGHAPGQRPHQAGSARRPESGLLDYSDYEHQSPVPPARGTRSQQISQTAGADATVAKANGRGHTSRAAPRTRNGQGEPDDPTESSSSGGSGGGSDKVSKPGRSRKAGNSKRPQSNDGGLGADGSQQRQKRQKPASDDRASQDGRNPEAIIGTLPDPVQEYYRRAIAPESTVMLDKQVVAEFVLRLYQAFGDLHAWAVERPLLDYLMEDGAERPGEAMDILKRAEFDKGWADFLSDLPAEEEALKHTYEDIHAQLKAAEKWMLPPPPDDNPARLVGWYRLGIIEAGNPGLRDAWEKYAKRMGQKKGPTAGAMARHAYEAMLKRLRDKDRSAWFPPTSQSPVAPPTSDRPLPERALDDRKRVAKEAQRLGFAVADIPGSWNFLSTLGIGGFGHAGLWVQYDSSGKIIDRKVAKEAYLGSYWDEEAYWMPDKEDRLPREFWIGLTLSNCDQAYNVIGPISYAVYPDSHMYRLYMDYCACGDLEELIRNHSAMVDTKTVDQDGKRLRCFLPIPVVYSIFEALASAACLMEKGHLPGDEAPGGWDSIFHRDMKPLNGKIFCSLTQLSICLRFAVFLDSPDSRVWPSIPVARLADYGLALESNPGNVGPPSTNSVNVGTPGYRAPEAEVYDAATGVPFYRYSSASDIFVIGRIMLSLVGLVPHPYVRQYRFDDEGGPSAFEDRSVKNFYPQSLLDLIDACLRPEPAQRITASDLYLNIHDQVTTCKGLRDIPLKFRPLGERDVVHFKPDAYLAWAK